MVDRTSQILKKLLSAQNTPRDVLVLMLCGAISLSWFSSSLVWGDDTSAPLNLAVFIKQYIYLIPHNIAFGPADISKLPFWMPLGLILTLSHMVGLDISAELFQRVFVYVYFTASGLSAYYLYRILFKPNSTYLGILSGLLYMFNFYSYFLWHSFSWIVCFYAFFPLILGLLARNMQERRGLSSAIVLALVTTITLTPAFITPPFMILFWAIIILYLSYVAFTSKKPSATIYISKYFGVFFSIWLILNSFWVIPQTLYFGNEIGRRAVQSDPLDLLRYNSTGISDILRLIGPEAYNGSYKGTLYYPWYGVYDTPLFIAISVMILTIIIASAVLSPKNRNVIFIFCMLILFGFMSKGLNPPLESFSEWIYGHFGIAAIFRSIWQRFMGIYFLAAAILFPLGLSLILAKLNVSSARKYLVSGVIVLVSIGVFMFPFWTDNVFPRRSGLLVSQKVTIPSDYEQAAKWVDAQNGDFNILPMPYPSMGLMALSWSNGINGYQGQYPFIMLSSKKYLIGDYIDSEGSKMISHIATGQAASTWELNRYNIKYIIMHNDANWQFIEGHNWWIGDNKQLLTKSLTTLSGLEKIKSFGQLDVYENKLYKDPTGRVDQLIGVDSTVNLLDKLAMTGEQGANANYQLSNTKIPLPTYIMDPFEQITGNFLDNGKITYSIPKKSDTTTSLVVNNSKRDIRYSADTNNIRVFSELPSPPFLQNAHFDSYDVESKLLAVQPISYGKGYYFVKDNQVWKVDATSSISGRIGTLTDVSLYSTLDKENQFDNPSFERGLWSGTSGDCSDSNSVNKVRVQLDTTTQSDANASILLESNGGLACASQTMAVRSGQKYALSFDYSSENVGQAGYYLKFVGSDHQPINQKLPTYPNKWTTVTNLVEVPEGVNSISLFIYGYPGEGGKTVTHYDNFSMRALSLEEEIHNYNPDSIKEFPVSVLGDSFRIEYAETRFDLENLIKNPSFEEGLWHKEVGDCFAYDDKPDLAQRLTTSQPSQGKFALQLEAKRHIACTGPDLIGVTGGSNYLLSFDYQSKDAKEAGYNISYDDNLNQSYGTRVPVVGNDWNHFSTVLQVPIGAKTAQLNLYSYGSESALTRSNVKYDNVKMVALPDITNKYFIKNASTVKYDTSANITIKNESPISKVVQISAVKANLFLNLGEGFSKGWALQPSKFAKNIYPSKDTLIAMFSGQNQDHLTLNGFEDGWYVDIEKYCKQDKLCTENADGSFNLELIAEFTPQRWFNTGILISTTSSLVCLGFLCSQVIKRRHKKQSVNRKSIRSERGRPLIRL